MKQRIVIIALVLGLAGVLAGCSADSPTAPKPSPTPTAYSITLESSASSAEVGAAILLTARATQGGSNAPDNTSVTFSLYQCPGAGVASDPSFENGMCQIVRTTTGGAATATVVSRTAGLYGVSAVVRGQTVSKNLRFVQPVNPLDVAIYNVVPDRGDVGGGEPVTIHGRGFFKPVAVTFITGGVERSAAVVSVNAAGTAIEVITPKAPVEGQVQPVDIKVTVNAGVTNPDGSSAEVSTTVERVFTYTKAVDVTPGAPAIYQIVPSEGLDRGGEQVTIYGANFYSPTVKLGDEDAQVVSVAADHSSLLLLTPKHSRAPGSVEKEFVTVTVTTVTSPPATRANGWAWVPPTTEPEAPVLYSVSPNRGTPRGGEEVTLRGANLCSSFDSVSKACLGAPDVVFIVEGFGERTASVLSYSNDGTRLVVITPSVSPNPVLSDANADIRVTNPKGSATLVRLFTFVGEVGDPQIFSVSPNKGSARGGDTVTIYGKYFLPPLQVQFSRGGLAVVLEVSEDRTMISVRVPAVQIPSTTEDILSDVTVRTQFGTGRDREFTLNNGYLYLADIVNPPTPELYALSPNSGPVDGGTRVTITGTGFQYPVQVYFGDRQAQVISNNYNQVICVTPSITVSQPSTPTNVDVSVLNITTGKRSNTLTFRYGEAMFMSAISPNHGPADEQTTVTIYGQGFVGPVEVVTAAGSSRIQANVLSVSGTEVIAKIQPLPAERRACGIVTAGVEVTNITSNIKATGLNFYYESPTPLITSVEITAPTKSGNDNTVPQYNPAGIGSCLTNPNWSAYKVTVRGSNFQKTGNDSSMVISIPGVTAELPTTYVSASEIYFMLPDLTGVTMQEISCITGTGTCGLQYVDTPVALTVKNLRSGCEDTLGGAIVIQPCDRTCRPVALTGLSFAAQPPANGIVGTPFVITLGYLPQPVTTPITVNLTYPGWGANPSAVTIPANFAGNWSVIVTPTMAGTGTIFAQSGSSTCQITAVSNQITVAMAITTASPLPAGTVGTAYTQTLTAIGGSTPYTWTVPPGTLPAGLSLSSLGVISGTPTAGGPATFTITVTDPLGNTGTKIFDLTINALLALTKSGPTAAASTITSSPPGINCGSTCSALFPGGSVTLTSSAAPTVWGGDCSACSGVTCNLTMTANLSCNVTYP